MENDLKKIGNQTIKLNSNPKIISTYSIVGPKEGQGPLGEYFHEVISDDTLGKDSFEKAESEMMYTAIKGAINSANLKEEDIDYLFAGDLLVGEEVLNKYDFLFLQDVEEYLKSLDKIQSLDFNYLVLAHGRKVLDKDSTMLLINKHRQAIYKYLNQIKENLKVPMNIDALLKKIIKENELTYNYKEYYFFRTSLVTCISYLADLDEIDYTLEDSDLLYYTKIK